MVKTDPVGCLAAQLGTVHNSSTGSGSAGSRTSSATGFGEMDVRASDGRAQVYALLLVLGAPWMFERAKLEGGSRHC